MGACAVGPGAGLDAGGGRAGGAGGRLGRRQRDAVPRRAAAVPRVRGHARALPARARRHHLDQRRPARRVAQARRGGGAARRAPAGGRPGTGRVTTPRQPYPWRVEDLLRWYVALGASLLGLAVAWWGISGTTRLSRGITWIDVAVLALVVGGLGNMRWLLQGRRAVAARRRAELPDAAELRALLVAPPRTVDEARVAIAGATRHHAPTCPAVQGKPV